MDGVMRRMQGLGDERREQELGLGFTAWKGLSSPPLPPCLLAQPQQEQETLCTKDALPSDTWASEETHPTLSSPGSL